MVPAVCAGVAASGDLTLGSTCCALSRPRDSGRGVAALEPGGPARLPPRCCPILGPKDTVQSERWPRSWAAPHDGAAKLPTHHSPAIGVRHDGEWRSTDQRPRKGPPSDMEALLILDLEPLSLQCSVANRIVGSIPGWIPGSDAKSRSHPSNCGLICGLICSRPGTRSDRSEPLLQPGWLGLGAHACQSDSRWPAVAAASPTIHAAVATWQLTRGIGVDHRQRGQLQPGAHADRSNQHDGGANDQPGW
jgi:hypothetical protein